MNQEKLSEIMKNFEKSIRYKLDQDGLSTRSVHGLKVSNDLYITMIVDKEQPCYTSSS